MIEGNNKPDFICIGYEKAGTTWLYTVLSEHQDVDLPPVKELRYLSEGNHIPEKGVVSQYFSDHWHNKMYQRLAKKKLKQWIKNPTSFFKDKWYRHFLLKPHNDEWYKQLFSAQKLSGDITPTYTFIPLNEIENINKRFPHLKIMIMLRNPVDRYWSKMKMNLAKHKKRSVQDISEKEWLDNLAHFTQEGTSVVEVIKQWKASYQHVFVGYYDEIQSDSEAFYDRVLSFLNLAPSETASEFLHKRVNKGLEKEMPIAVEKAICQFCEKETQELDNYLQSAYSKKWLSQLEAVLKS